MPHQVDFAILQAEKISICRIYIWKSYILRNYHSPEVPIPLITFDVEIEWDHKIEAQQESNESENQDPFNLLLAILDSHRVDIKVIVGQDILDFLCLI